MLIIYFNFIIYEKSLRFTTFSKFSRRCCISAWEELRSLISVECAKTINSDVVKRTSKSEMNNNRSFFTIFPQYKNANISNFVWAVPFKIKKTNQVCNFERVIPFTNQHLILQLLTSHGANNKENGK